METTPAPMIKSTVTFIRPFTIAGFPETLPAGEYDLETEISAPAEPQNPWHCDASVQVLLHPRKAHPGLARCLTVQLSALEQALARDKLSGQPNVDLFVEEMLADPMVQLVMRADRVSDSEIRHLYTNPASSSRERHASAAPQCAAVDPSRSGTNARKGK